jgi:L-lactate dehydrogenase (cytochrome)
MDQHARYPAISDLKARARRRIPHFVWEFFDSATGSESVLPRNRTALDRVLFRPAALRGEIVPELGTTFLGRDYPVPFGIAPVGMSGLVWPEAERAAGAPRRGGGHSLLPVHRGHAHARGPRSGAQGDQGWFQMYPPRDPGIRADMLPARGRRGFTR